MKRFLLTFVLPFLAGFLFMQAFLAMTKAADHPWHASYRVSFNGGAGSATAIGPRLLLTNWHVAGTAGNRGAARSANGEQCKIVTLTSDQRVDLALCETDADVRFADISDVPANPDEEVSLYGYGPGAQPLRIARGNYIGQIEGQNYWTTIAQSGDSGGGVFNSSNKLVGVNRAVDGQFDTQSYHQGQSLSVPLRSVQSFLTQSCEQCERGGFQPARRPPPKNWPQPAPEPSPEPEKPLTPVPPKVEPKPVEPAPVPPKVEVIPGPAGPQGPAGPPGKDADEAKLVALSVQIAALQATIEQLNNRPVPSPQVSQLPVRIIKPNGQSQDLNVPLDGKHRLDLKLAK